MLNSRNLKLLVLIVPISVGASGCYRHAELEGVGSFNPVIEIEAVEAWDPAGAVCAQVEVKNQMYVSWDGSLPRLGVGLDALELTARVQDSFEEPAGKSAVFFGDLAFHSDLYKPEGSRRSVYEEFEPEYSGEAYGRGPFSFDVQWDLSGASFMQRAQSSFEMNLYGPVSEVTYSSDLEIARPYGTVYYKDLGYEFDQKFELDCGARYLVTLKNADFDEAALEE